MWQRGRGQMELGLHDHLKKNQKQRFKDEKF
jgi:hypothetical protein